jgi:caffeoyl-CoA O-methyltransferase
MEFIEAQLEHYVCQHTSPEPKALQDLNRQTHLSVLQPRMLSGHFQGRFLSMISHMIRPARILEIGTYTGYSAICLAEGLPAEGKLITIDVNDELERFCREHIEQAGFSDKIELVIGDAKEVIPTLAGSFDLVFIDADKKGYAAYYDMVFDRISPGGYVLIDNVLWSGKVLDHERYTDKETVAIRAFNEKVRNDNRVEHILLPIRDGLMLVRKKN